MLAVRFNVNHLLSHRPDIFGAMVAVGDIEEAEIENHSLHFSLVNMESVSFIISF